MRLALIVIGAGLAIVAPVYALGGFRDRATAGMTIEIAWTPAPSTPTVTPTATGTPAPSPRPHTPPKPEAKCDGPRDWHRHTLAWGWAWHRNKSCERASQPGESPAQPPRTRLAGFKKATRRQRSALRAAWRAVAGRHALGSAGDVDGFYVTQGAGTTNRFAAGCVARRRHTAVVCRVFRRAGKANRWSVVTDFNVQDVDADGERHMADDTVPPAAYDRLVDAVRHCAGRLGVPDSRAAQRRGA